MDIIKMDSGQLQTYDKENLTIGKMFEIYMEYEVTTRPSSQVMQKHDIGIFLNYIHRETGRESFQDWTPRLSQSYKYQLENTFTSAGRRKWKDITINRMIAHLKTFSKWCGGHIKFPLGEPMRKISTKSKIETLNIVKALTPIERRKMLDAADLLLEIGGRSKDRLRNKAKRIVRKKYRPYRNRAIIYLLIETGMRRAATTTVRLSGIDFTRKIVEAKEKGGYIHPYPISTQGLQALQDYIERERPQADELWQSSVLFLPAPNPNSKTGELKAGAISVIWKEVCKMVGLEGKGPHAARHAMGRYIMEKTGNPEAVQRQLGHVNATYSLLYTRITDKELTDHLDERV